MNTDHRDQIRAWNRAEREGQRAKAMKPILSPSQVRRLVGVPVQRKAYDRFANFGAKAKRKLTDQAVREIRARWDAGEKLETIAAAYGVSIGWVSLIGTRQRWKEVAA